MSALLLPSIGGGGGGGEEGGGGGSGGRMGVRAEDINGDRPKTCEEWLATREVGWFRIVISEACFQ